MKPILIVRNVAPKISHSTTSGNSCSASQNITSQKITAPTTLLMTPTNRSAAAMRPVCSPADSADGARITVSWADIVGVAGTEPVPCAVAGEGRAPSSSRLANANRTTALIWRGIVIPG